MEMNIFHNGQFYIGVIKFEKDGKICYVERVFGMDPDKETLDQFIHQELLYLIDNVKTEGYKDKKVSNRINPKRLQRKVSKERKMYQLSTKTQDFLKKEYETNKKIRKKLSKERKEAFEERKRMLKRKKAKQKHKGK
ncbi:DUF2992 domain-containing protein [Macrococcus epidermidis]|uniref:DUF2992 domain-containing protein n=1 Tax=Macrococcus epidermidis TaxID=1902580 RepID=A0A327ZR48_9STAP|nr:YjdF family protein [Macrococcus epidermidis]RAK44606.1 DUF2992 domain-containing protein [Macrococcus epidermidis]